VGREGSLFQKVGRVSISGLFALLLLLGAARDGNAQQQSDIAPPPAGAGAAGQQSVTGTDASMAPGGAPPVEQQPRAVPLGMTPEGLADKARANAGQTGSTTRVPAVEIPKEQK
jgi:hypothetical protein